MLRYEGMRGYEGMLRYEGMRGNEGIPSRDKD